MDGKKYAFAAMWLSIIGISVYDGYCVLGSRSSMHIVERNPVGRLLIHWNGGDVWLLLAVKTLGTLLAASLLLVLYWTRPPVGWIACAATAVFQLMLLLYLHAA